MKALLQAGLASILLWMAGCMHYEPVERERAVAIALAPVINESEIAQIIAPLNRNVREGLAHSRNFRLVDIDEAEVVLQLRVRSLNRRALARDPLDTGRPLSYRERVRVTVEWVSELPPPWGPDPVTRVESEFLLYAQPALVSAESSALAELSEDLTAQIIDRLEWPAPDLEE